MLPVQIVYFFVRLFIKQARLGQKIADLGVHLFLVFLELMPLLGREGLQLLGRQRLALPHRDLDDAGAGDRKLKSEFERASAGIGEQDLLRLLRLVHDAGLLFFVFLGLEDLGDLALHELNELFDIAPELAALARRELDRARPVGVLEIVDVAPVIRDRLVQGDPLDDGLGDGVPAGARDAGHEDIVPVIFDGEAELDRLHRPRLADDLVLERKIGCCIKRKLRRIAGMPEFGCRYFQVFDVHRGLLLSYTVTQTSRNQKIKTKGVSRGARGGRRVKSRPLSLGITPEILLSFSPRTPRLCKKISCSFEKNFISN